MVVVTKEDKCRIKYKSQNK